MQAFTGHLGNVEFGGPRVGQGSYGVFIAEGGREGGTEGDLVEGYALF
jgi:hypothetical protein